MTSLYRRQVSQLFRQQHGVASRPQLRRVGVSAAVENQRVAKGEWDRPTKRVVRLSGSGRSPAQDLMIALLEAGPLAVASHQSAAWLWGLLPAPERHAVTMGWGTTARSGPFTVHRLKGDGPVVSNRNGFATTNPLRTLVDLAAVAGPDVVDEAVDRAVASRLVTTAGLWAELDRVGRRGRRGSGAMRASLRRRGLNEGPHPSVLEARFHRLLRSGGITPISVEVRMGDEGGYRVDSLLAPRVAAEVDGHAHHSTPEQKAYDERRRADLRLTGIFLLVFTWRDVLHDGRRVLAQCHKALARYGSAETSPAGKLSGA